MKIKFSKAQSVESARRKYPSDVLVYFAHDIEDGWYEALFPHGYGHHSGSYGKSVNIEKICLVHDLEIVWLGGMYYCPWKE